MKGETAVSVGVFLLKVPGVPQGSQASRVTEDQWDHGDVRDHLERKAGKEHRDQSAQQGPRESVA